MATFHQYEFGQELFDDEQRVWLEAIIMCPLSVSWTGIEGVEVKKESR